MTESGSSPENGGDGSDPAELAHWLFDRARAGESERLGAYLDAGVPQDLTDPAGNTLLMLAAYHGHPATVATLIGHGATVDALNDRGQSPLAGAVVNGDRLVAELLVGNGANPDAGSPSARQTAYYFEQTEMIDLLTPADDQRSNTAEGT